MGNKFFMDDIESAVEKYPILLVVMWVVVRFLIPAIMNRKKGVSSGEEHQADADKSANQVVAVANGKKVI